MNPVDNHQQQRQNEYQGVNETMSDFVQTSTTNKRTGKCGQCGQVGHNKRTCPQNRQNSK